MNSFANAKAKQFTAWVSTTLPHSLLLCLALVGMIASSPSAAAANCSVSAVGPTLVTAGAAVDSAKLQVEISGAGASCAASGGTITVLDDSAGVVSPNVAKTYTSALVADTTTVAVDLSGKLGSATVRVTCSACEHGSDTVDFTVKVVNIVTLSPTNAASESLQTNPDKALELSVSKKINGLAMADEQVDWTVSSGPANATLSQAQSKTSANDAGHEGGIASSTFIANAPGSYVVTASTQDNPGCTEVDCATYSTSQFSITVAAPGAETADTDTHHRNVVLGSVITAATTLALLASDNGHQQEAAAVSSSLVITGGNGQSGQPNTALPTLLSVKAQDNGSDVAGVTINWTVSGGATLSTNTTVSNSFGLSGVYVVSLGAGPGPVIVTASRADDPSASVQFTLTVIAPALPGLSLISGNFQSAPTSTQVPSPLVVEATLDGAAQSGISITWAVTSGDASINSVSNGGNTDAGGISSAVIDFGPTPGTVTVTATRGDDPSIFQTFTLFSTLTRTLSYISGDGQTGNPNTALPLPLVVEAQDNGAIASGITINWTASGGASLSAASSITDGTGQASVTVTDLGSGLGPVQVTGTRADDATASVTFFENITPPALTITGGDGQSGIIGSSAPTALSVHLVDGGGNSLVGQPIAWNVIGGGAILTGPFLSTDGNGNASMTFDFGTTPGPITIQASAFSGTAVVNFSATATSVGAIAAASGDGQTPAFGSATAPLTIQVTPVAANIPVTFSIISGTGSLSTYSALTDALGQASTVLTVGYTAGPVVVRASVPGGFFVDFTTTPSGSATTAATSGGGQTLTPNVPSLPMAVTLTDANNAPLVGAIVTWTTTSGTLGSGNSTTTDANGVATNTITITTSVAVTVTADFAGSAGNAAVSTFFTFNASIASIATLTPNQVSVGNALDQACLDLAPIVNPTPDQQDLLIQCQAITAAAASSPDAVANALDELIPDVAQTQSQTGQAAATAQFDNIKGRIETLRGGSFGSSLNGLTLTAPGGNVPLLALGAALLGEDQPKPQAEAFSRWGFFASGNIGRGNANSTDLSPGYDLDIKGITVGVDYRTTDQIILGAALGYTRQDTTLNGGQGSVNMDGYSLSGYATWYRENNWYMDGVLTLGHNNFDETRLIAYTLPAVGLGLPTTVYQQASASSGGGDISTALTFGRDFQKQAWSYGFYGRGLYSHLSFDSYQESLTGSASGSGLGLSVESRTTTALSSVLGGKLNYTYSTNWGVLLPHFELEWQKEYRSDPESFQAFFINDPSATPIVVNSAGLDSSYFRIGVGLSMVLTHGRSGFLLYQRVVSRENISQYNVSLGFRIEF